MRKIKLQISDLKYLSFQLSITFLLIYVTPFAFLWHSEIAHKFKSFFSGSSKEIMMSMIVVYFVSVGIFIIGILLHELIHGVAFSFFCKNGFKSITFGYSKKDMVLFTHCKEPLNRIGFWIGSLSPLILLGLIPAVVGILLGRIDFIVFGFIFSSISVGDIYIVINTRWLSNRATVIDDPDSIGITVMDE